MLKTTLLNIGLSEKEVGFYLLIIQHREITAGEISKIRGGSRTHTYDTLNKLLDKSLVTYAIKNNIKYFKAIDPEKLLDFLKEKKEKIEQEEKEISKIIPEIKQLQEGFIKEEVKIEIFEGKEGLKTIMNDILKTKQNFIVWGATTKVREYLPDFFIQKYLNERKKEKIHAKQLFTDFYGVLKSPFSENRKLPKEFASPTTTAVYGNKVAIFLWFEIPKVILIENKDLAKSYEKHFELMWKQAKR